MHLMTNKDITSLLYRSRTQFKKFKKQLKKVLNSRQIKERKYKKIWISQLPRLNKKL